jgi:hypothetical protein
MTLKSVDYYPIIKDKEMKRYVPHTLCEEALKVGEELGLDNETVNMYNALCEGTFNFHNGTGDMFFNPESNGIGWSHDRNWVKRKLNPLVKKGLLNFVSLEAPRDARYRIWFWYSPKAALRHTIDIGCFPSNYRLRNMMNHLDLPMGWNATGECNINGFKLECKKRSERVCYYRAEYRGEVIYLYNHDEMDGFPIYYLNMFIDDICDPYELSISTIGAIREEVKKSKGGFRLIISGDYCSREYGTDVYEKELGAVERVISNAEQEFGVVPDCFALLWPQTGIVG